MILISALPNLAGIRLLLSTLLSKLLFSPFWELNDWSLVRQSLGSLVPSSVIVDCESIPRGATLQWGNYRAASFGSGSCHPFSTLSFSIVRSVALWPGANLSLPRDKAAAVRRLESRMGRRGNWAPSVIHSPKRGQSECRDRRGARRSTERNFNPGDSVENGWADSAPA